jgi:acyl-CoA thioesterase II
VHIADRSRRRRDHGQYDDDPVNHALEELCAALTLRPDDHGRLVGHSVKVGDMRTVFGGQLLAQMVVAADQAVPGKTVKSLHAMFVRPAGLDAPLWFEVEVMHSGRLYCSASVSVSQGDRLCARALVLLDTADEELATHSVPAPGAQHPDVGGRRSAWGAAEICVVGDVDLGDLTASGPPELLVWARFEGAPSGDGLNRGLLAYASEPYFFGAALRPHAGLSQSLAYTSIVPAVITHAVTFHAPVSAADWLLLQISSPHLGRGRIYGQASVFSESGEFVASVSQENQLRPLRSD